MEDLNTLREIYRAIKAEREALEAVRDSLVQIANPMFVYHPGSSVPSMLDAEPGQIYSDGANGSLVQ